MQTNQITLNVDPDTASAFLRASDEEQQRIAVLVRSQLRRSRKETADELEKLMNKMSAYAKEQGMTDEILREILSERG